MIFNNTIVTKGFQIQRSIDSIGLSFVSNISISNCTKNKDCKLDIIYYRNNDTAKIFSNKIHGKSINICCDEKNAQDNKCKLNSINLPKDSPYTHVEYSQSNSMKSVTVPSISEAVWTVLITTCVDSETSFTLNGDIDYKPVFSTYIDERVKKISSFCLQSSIASFIFLIFYIAAQNKFNSQIITTQTSFYVLTIFSCISDLFIYLFFDFYNKYYLLLLYLLYFSSLSRSISRSLLFKITYDGLQFPNVISVFITIPLLCIFSLSFYCELTGIHNITYRITGDWLLGYGDPITSFLLFLSNILTTVYIIYHAKSAKDITNTEKRHKFIYLISFNLVIYIALSCLFVVIRMNSSLYFSRKLELLTFCIEPFHFYALMLINSWFLFIFNPQGWEQIGINQNDDNADSLGIVVENNHKPSLVGNTYSLPKSMLNSKPEFTLDLLEEEEEDKENNENA